MTTVTLILLISLTLAIPLYFLKPSNLLFYICCFLAILGFILVRHTVVLILVGFVIWAMYQQKPKQQAEKKEQEEEEEKIILKDE